MKKKLLVFAAIFLAGAITINAQGGGNGGFQRPPVEERVKNVMSKLESFKLDAAKTAEVDSIFTRSYKAQDAKREEVRAAGNPDREAIRAEMQKLAADRDDKLKKVFTEEQFKEWKEKIEPSLRPQRQGGGGGGNN
jgi:acyl-CoA reductase-like NAD-dependent aldehyde dehydrogenase